MNNENPNIICRALSSFLSVSLSGDSKDYTEEKLHAIYYIGYQLKEGLEIMQSLQFFDGEDHARMKLPLKIFSWSLDDCMARRQENMVWLQLLYKMMSLKCLELRKRETDFDEMKRLITLIIENHKQLKCSDTVDYLNSCQLYIDLEANLGAELVKNTAEAEELYMTSLLTEFTRPVLAVEPRGSKRLPKSAENRVKLFIRERYKMEWKKVTEEECIENGEANEKRIQKEIDFYKRKILREMECTDCVRSRYAVETNELHNAIDLLTMKLENELDFFEQQSYRLKNDKIKMQADQILLQNDIDRFKQNIDDLYWRENQAMEDKERKQALRLEKKKQKRKEKKLLEQSNQKDNKIKHTKIKKIKIKKNKK